MMRSVFCLLLVALLMVRPAGAKDLHPGDVPPDSLGWASTGERVKLADYRGKVVIISFWASWCAPCRKELPALANVQTKVGTGELQVLAVNYGESYQRYRQIVSVLKETLKDAPLKLISDEHQYYGHIYGVKGIPHMVLIGRDGRIAAVHEGYGESRIPQLVDEINTLLAAPKEATSGT
jgi:thiol-disulfide isomerase/thioredoxin